MSDPTAGRPPGYLDLDDQRLGYDTYHGSTGVPPGSTSAGEPIRHEQAVQDGPRLRRAETRDKEKSRLRQHEQGLGALRSMRITHMAPRIQQGLGRQVQAPIKKPAFGDEDDGENEDDEEVREQSPQYF
jgi:hypothetical protein